MQTNKCVAMQLTKEEASNGEIKLQVAVIVNKLKLVDKGSREIQKIELVGLSLVEKLNPNSAKWTKKK